MGFISWYRDDVENPLDLAILSDVPETAGGEVRTFLATNSASILATDTILMVGEADFGDTFTLLLPPAIYRGSTAEEGYAPARWLTHTIIDGIVGAGDPGDQSTWDKRAGTAGFTFTSYVRFENFYLGGECSDQDEDGGLLSWQPTYEGNGVAEFVNCEIDASGGMDWGIYTWQNSTGIRRTVRITDSIVRFCRFGVALAGEGWQSAELTRVQGYGDANGSTSLGTSSSRGLAAGDDGAVLTLLYNRGAAGTPYIRMVACNVEAIGLSEQYQASYGCPRIAALATNCYERGMNNAVDHPTAPNAPRTDLQTGNTSYFFNCTSQITPGVSEETYDIDIRERVGTPIIRELGSMPSPPDYPNAVEWQPTSAELCWLGSVGSSAHPTAVNDVIANAETLISSRVLTPNASGKGPKWKGSGWMWFGADGADNRNLTLGTVGGTSALNNHFHVDGTGHILVRVKLDTANDGNFKMICCNCRLSNTHKGFGLRISNSGVSMAVWAGGAAAILGITHAGPFVSGQEHVIETVVKVGPNASWINVDGGTPVTGTIGTLTTGDSNEQFTIGARSNLSIDQFNGQIRDLVIASSELSSEYVTDWRNRLLARSTGGIGCRVGLGL